MIYCITILCPSSPAPPPDLCFDSFSSPVDPVVSSTGGIVLIICLLFIEPITNFVLKHSGQHNQYSSNMMGELVSNTIEHIQWLYCILFGCILILCQLVLKYTIDYKLHRYQLRNFTWFLAPSMFSVKA